MRRIAIAISICVLTLPLFARTAPLAGTPPGRLVERAKKELWIRVLVGVRDEHWRPEGTLRPQDVAIQRGRGKRAVDAVLRAHGQIRTMPEWRFRTVPGFVAEVNEAGLRNLMEDERVASIEEELIGEFQLGQSVTSIGATAVHTGSPAYRGQGQIVVVVDNGVDDGHPFFGTRVLRAEGACFSGERIADSRDGTFNLTSVCPNGQQRQIADGAGVPCEVGTMTDEVNPCHHGTRVAGVIAGDAVTNNGAYNTTMTGVAPAARIIPIQIASQQCTSSGCESKGYKSSVILALDHIADVLVPKYPGEIAAVNVSLGFTPLDVTCDGTNQLFKTHVDNLRSLGVAVVAATGNNARTSEVTLPACLSSVISVSASTDGDTVPDYANVAGLMHLFAPGGAPGTGTGITTSQNRGCTGCTAYYEDHGTSLAAPHVAGALALLREQTPSATIDDMLAALLASPKSVTDTRTGGTVTKPRLQVDHAMSQVQPPGAPTGLAATGISGSSVELVWTAPNPLPSGAKYRVRYRTAKSAGWTLAADDVTTTTYTHASLTSGTLYQYEVTTKTTSGVFSTGAHEYAVTRAFSAIATPALIDGVYIGELREAADAWRGFMDGQLADAFTSYADASGPVTAAIFTDIVTALNAARNLAGLAPFEYVGAVPPAQGGVIDRRYVEQLQTAMK